MLYKNLPIQRINIYFTIILMLGLLGIYIGVVNMYVWIFLLIVRLFFTSKKEIGVFLLMLGSGLFGRLFSSNLLTFTIMTAFPIIGSLLLWNDIKSVIRTNATSYLFLTIVVIFFVVYFLFGNQNEFANGKILRLVYRGYIYLTAFLLLFKTKDFNSQSLTYLFSILAMFYLSQAYQIFNVRPSSFFDISFFRNAFMDIGRNEEGTAIVNTHTLGYLSLGAIIFTISKKSAFKNLNLPIVLLSFFSFTIILISGARQVLIAYIILFVFFALVRGGRLSIKNLAISLVFLIAFSFVLNYVSRQSVYLSQMMSEDNTTAERLHRDIYTPFEVLKINPISGIGFGMYGEYANKDYPHNMILEILCEEGVVGLCILSLIVLYFFYYSKVNISNLITYTTNSSILLFSFFLLFFLKSMISGDISSNIAVFCILFCFSRRQKVLIWKIQR